MTKRVADMTPEEHKKCLEWHRLWRSANRDRLHEYGIRYRQKNGDKIREWNRLRKPVPKAIARARYNAWARANPEKIKMKNIRWRRANPDKVKESRSKIKAKERKTRILAELFKPL